METKPIVASELVQETQRAPTASVRRMPRKALYCLTAAGVFFAGHFTWTLVNGEAPPAIVPPAGQVMAGTVPFRFAVISDNRGNMSVFEEALAMIKEEDPSLILHAGDIVKRYNPRHFDWLLHELDEENLTVPFCPVPGNHDIDWTARDMKNRYRLYNRAFGPRRYWFSYANALFVAFDDSDERCSSGDLKWLDSVLERFRGRYELCFVYMHVPPRDPRPGCNHALKAGEADKLMPILKKHDVTAVFAGHLHYYAEDEIEGIPIYISGGAGEKKDAGEAHHYLLCSVDASGRFTVERRDLSHRIDTDYPEYVFRTKFPDGVVLLGAVGLLLTGVVMSVRRVPVGRDPAERLQKQA